MSEAPAQPKRPRRLPRFSLRSLILLVALAGTGYGLWVRWEPGVVEVFDLGYRERTTSARMLCQSEGRT